MKITFNKVNNIINQNIHCDYLDIDAKYSRLNFGDQTVTVTLTKGKTESSSTGLHIYNVKSDTELEGILINAVNRALNNNFKTIYIHI